METILLFFKRQLKTQSVLCISGVAAAISMLLVPPSMDYLEYMNFKVLAVLFCMMVVTVGFRQLGVFEVLAQNLLQRTSNVRTMSLVLILLCFFSSMLITNDVALLTFVPFTITVLAYAGKGNLMFVVAMQTIAANLGSTLTPVGNPQNLYLYSFFQLQPLDFFSITAPISMISFILIIVFVLFTKNDRIEIQFDEKATIQDHRKLSGYVLLLLLCLLSVFGLVPYQIMLIAVCLLSFCLDKKVFSKVDYSLIATFVFFFIFVGNLSQLSTVQMILAELIRGREMFFSVGLSQIISNVPAAVMLSSFTNNYAVLIAGTNIGGLGTLVASLASLISFRLYAEQRGSVPMKYIGMFTGMNVVILVVLSVFSFLWIG